MNVQFMLNYKFSPSFAYLSKTVSIHTVLSLKILNNTRNCQSPFLRNFSENIAWIIVGLASKELKEKSVVYLVQVGEEGRECTLSLPLLLPGQNMPPHILIMSL